MNATHRIHRKNEAPINVHLKVSGNAPTTREVVKRIKASLFRFERGVWRYRSGRAVDGVIERITPEARSIERLVCDPGGPYRPIVVV